MTSSYLHEVAALVQKIRDLSKILYFIGDVNDLQIPYVGLDSYRLPTSENKNVVILCHSVQNRRLAITDVEGSLYENLLKQSSAVMGKKLNFRDLNSFMRYIIITKVVI